MSITVILGSLFDITDPKGELDWLYRQGQFIKWIHTKNGWVSKDTGFLFPKSKMRYDVVQETGAGKTVLLSIKSYLSHLNYISSGLNRKISGNFRLGWDYKNIGKPKEDWRPSILCMDDLTNASYTDILLDDIAGTITAWNTTEADLIKAAALTARKNHDNLLITAQYAVNQIPPDLRRITGEYHVPFIQWEDSEKKSPDGHNTPLKLLDLRFDSNLRYTGCKGYDLTSRTAKIILNGFDTLEISTALKADGTPSEAIGSNDENDLLKLLTLKLPNEEIKYKGNEKGGYDITAMHAMFDSVHLTDSLTLRTSHKDMWHLYNISTEFNIPGYIAYNNKRTKEWKFIKITEHLCSKWNNKDIILGKCDSKKLKIDNIMDICSVHH